MAVHATHSRDFSLPQAFSSLDQRLAELAGRWFLNSGIQEPSGGVARYHHSDTRQNARVSTEITGYTVSTLVFLYERHGNQELLDAAIRAGRFLTRVAWSPALKTFPFEHSHNGDAPQPLTYFFDSGIIARGLLALWKVTNDPEYLETAVRTGESMGFDFATADTWHPILELPGKYPLQWTKQWSRQPGCYQLKSALAWQELHQVTGDKRFSQWYEAAVAKALSTHEDFLPAETREKTMDRLHAYCYFLEALLPVADRPHARQALADGILRVSKYLREIRGDFERSDVNAQLLRVRLAASSCFSVNEAEAAEEVSAIQRFQIDEPAWSDHGGFWFGYKQGRPLPFINPVSTAFCLQAYQWWLDYQAGQFVPQAII
jgi:hypothetical protein